MKKIITAFLILASSTLSAFDCPLEVQPLELPLPSPATLIELKDPLIYSEGEYSFYSYAQQDKKISQNYFLRNTTQSANCAVNNAPPDLDFIAIGSAQIGNYIQNPDNSYTFNCRYVYRTYRPLTCPSDYSIANNGKCNINDPFQCPSQINPDGSTNCDDGYPSNVLDHLGYATCDRPAAQQCADSSYILATDNCPDTSLGICNSYASCYATGVSESDCATASYFDFTYTDPQNFTFSCTTIDINSPDHPDNGGNGDGLVTNDPQSTQNPLSNVDPGVLAHEIDLALENDFSNVEDSVRNNTNQITDTLEQMDQNQTQSLTDIENAIGTIESANLDTGSLEGVIQDGNNSNGTKLDSIYDELDQAGSDITDGLDDLRNDLAQYEANRQADEQANNNDNSECVPSLGNMFCQSDGDFMGGFVDGVQNSVSNTISLVSDSLENAYNELVTDNQFLGSLEESSGINSLKNIFSARQCNTVITIPVTGSIAQYLLPQSGTITCEDLDPFVSLFDFLLIIYTMLSLVNILFSDIVPQGSPQRSLGI